MALLFKITEGWTKELGPFILRIDGVAFSLDGMTVEVYIRSRRTGDLVPSGKLTVRVAANQTTTGKGQVYLKPAADAFSHLDRTYDIHWKVTDVSNDVCSFPGGEPDTLEVYQL